MEIIGNTINKFSKEFSNLEALFEKNTIRGSIIHIDHYGNAISNITENYLNTWQKKENIVSI